MGPEKDRQSKKRSTTLAAAVLAGAVLAGGCGDARKAYDAAKGAEAAEAGILAAIDQEGKEVRERVEAGQAEVSGQVEAAQAQIREEVAVGGDELRREMTEEGDRLQGEMQRGEESVRASFDSVGEALLAMQQQQELMGAVIVQQQADIARLRLNEVLETIETDDFVLQVLNVESDHLGDGEQLLFQFRIRSKRDGLWLGPMDLSVDGDQRFKLGPYGISDGSEVVQAGNLSIGEVKPDSFRPRHVEMGEEVTFLVVGLVQSPLPSGAALSTALRDVQVFKFSEDGNGGAWEGSLNEGTDAVTRTVRP